MRDPITDEVVPEGGALVLADNGICCIDEPISISKAGITTTLVARPSILTVANPLYGRYNPKVSPVENVNLPAVLLSHFDLLLLLLDKPPRDDERLAQHVTHVHIAYITFARRCRPVVPPDVSSYIVDSHVRLRKRSKDDAQRDRSHMHASARARFSELRLAKESLHDEDGDDADARDADRPDTNRVYIKDTAQAAVAAGTGRPMRERPRRVGRGPDHERDVQDEEGEGAGRPTGRALDGGHSRARSVLRHS
ncbi:MCM2/3/5 family-domain-containing protein [Lactarius hengduanensis]|nr:MCM2/3/5 family-domain-containing protein [Lactarius hengduanensis]